MPTPMKSWNTEEIHLSQIDWDDRSFRLTYSRPLTALAVSLKEIGLQNLPVLQEKGGNRFRIVCGFRRLLVLSRNREGSLRCRTAPVEAEPKDLLLFNFLENLDRGYNTVEQSWVLKRLSAFMEREEIIRDIMPLLQLPPKEEILNRSLSLAEISPHYWPLVLEGKLFPEVIQELLQAHRRQADLILALFIQFRWSFQKQREFLKDLQELSQRKEEPPESVLTSESFVSILAGIGGGTPQQRGEEVRKFFRTRLFPVLSETASKLAGQMAEMDLDSRTRLIPPPFFEGGQYALEIKFTNPEELKTSLKKIDRAAASGKLDHLP
jgi:hypothetical protein